MFLFSFPRLKKDISKLRTETAQFSIFYGVIVVLFHFLYIFA